MSVTAVGEVAADTGEEAYKLEPCFVKSWSTSGDADDRPTEEVAFYYNKIAFQYASSSDGR
jgi:type VI protein secretion system component Hcp